MAIKTLFSLKKWNICLNFKQTIPLLPFRPLSTLSWAPRGWPTSTSRSRTWTDNSPTSTYSTSSTGCAWKRGWVAYFRSDYCTTIIQYFSPIFLAKNSLLELKTLRDTTNFSLWSHMKNYKTVLWIRPSHLQHRHDTPYRGSSFLGSWKVYSNNMKTLLSMMADQVWPLAHFLLAFRKKKPEYIFEFGR